MSALSVAPWAIAGLSAVAAILLWTQLGDAREKIGALDQANRQLTIALTEKQNALKDRARTDDDVRRLAPDAVLERMR